MPTDWSQLPADLLEIISTKIIFITDYIRFRAVCTSWRSASPARPRHLSPQLPWLLLPYDPSPENADAGRLFFDLLDRRIHKLDLPETRGKRFFGSAYGWLVLEQGLAISLLNPVTRAHIRLPPLNSSPKFFSFHPSEEEAGGVGQHFLLVHNAHQPFVKFSMKKVILSSSPTLNPDCTVVAVLESLGILAFCRIRDESWTVVCESYHHLDVTYQNGRFYAVTRDGAVIVIVYDFDASQRTVLPSMLRYGGDQKYLVDQSSRELLMVVWNFRSQSTDGRMKYDVFKLDVDGQPEWLKVEDIGSSMLFLGGNNYCFSLSAGNFDEWRGNFIYHTVPYFLQQYEDGDLISHAMSSFSLKDDSFMQIACNLGASLFHWPPPAWVTPSLL